MKLKFLPAAVITAPVEVLVPGEEVDSYEICKFKARFRRLDSAESQALTAQFEALRDDVNSSSKLIEIKKQALLKNLVGWDGLPGKDDEGRDVELPFSEELRATLLKERCYQEGLYEIFISSQRAPQKIDAKNSATSV